MAALKERLCFKHRLVLPSAVWQAPSTSGPVGNCLLLRVREGSLRKKRETNVRQRISQGIVTLGGQPGINFPTDNIPFFILFLLEEVSPCQLSHWDPARP